MADRNASDFFNSYAPDFDAIYGSHHTLTNRLVNRFLRRSMRLRYQKTLQGCTPASGKSALDIGCGPGHYSIALARQGMETVWGIDFAPAMIDLADKKAVQSGVEKSCRFILGDFLTHDFDRRFDYSLAMGFMDYIAEPAEVIARALSLTTIKAFFSFPASGGILAWQRRRRYRHRCDLFMYRRHEIERLFENISGGKFEIEKLGRDYFVTVFMA